MEQSYLCIFMYNRAKGFGEGYGGKGYWGGIWFQARSLRIKIFIRRLLGSKGYEEGYSGYQGNLAQGF